MEMALEITGGTSVLTTEPSNLGNYRRFTNVDLTFRYLCFILSIVDNENLNLR